MPAEMRASKRKRVTRNEVQVWACPNCDVILGRQYDRFGNKIWDTYNHRRGDGYSYRKPAPTKAGPKYIFD